MERDFAAYLFTLFCPLFTSAASFSIAHEYSVRNLNTEIIATSGEWFINSNQRRGNEEEDETTENVTVGWSVDRADARQ